MSVNERKFPNSNELRSTHRPGVIPLSNFLLVPLLKQCTLPQQAQNETMLHMMTGHRNNDPSCVSVKDMNTFPCIKTQFSVNIRIHQHINIPLHRIIHASWHKRRAFLYLPITVMVMVDIIHHSRSSPIPESPIHIELPGALFIMQTRSSNPVIILPGFLPISGEMISPVDR